MTTATQFKTMDGVADLHGKEKMAFAAALASEERGEREKAERWLEKAIS